MAHEIDNNKSEICNGVYDFNQKITEIKKSSLKSISLIDPHNPTIQHEEDIIKKTTALAQLLSLCLVVKSGCNGKVSNDLITKWNSRADQLQKAIDTIKSKYDEHNRVLQSEAAKTLSDLFSLPVVVEQPGPAGNRHIVTPDLDGPCP